MSKPTLPLAIRTFLELSFGEPERPYRTQRDMREDAMRVVGFTQAQEALRHMLGQVDTDQARELSDVRADGQLKPMAGPGSSNLWIPPEYPVKKR
jgi:hypothetical protein